MRLYSWYIRTIAILIFAVLFVGADRLKDGAFASGADTASAEVEVPANERRAPDLKQITTEVRRAVRQLVSPRASERQRGRKRLRALGGAVAPQLELWVRLARDDIARVDELLAELKGERPGRIQISDSVDRFLHTKLRQAKALAENGEYLQAQRLAESVLGLDGERLDAWEIRQFVRDCEERMTIRDVLEPRFDVPQRVYQVGESPVLTFRIHNHTRETALIYLDQGVLGEANVTVLRYFMNGEWKSAEQRITVRVAETPEPLQIEAGKTWEQTVEFQMQDVLPLAGAVARVQLRGRFRPTRWTAQNPKENTTLSLPRMEFWIVPPGQSRLTDKPLEKMTAALLFEKDESFFVGGQLTVWAGEFDSAYNGKFVQTLIGQVGALDGVRLAMACRFLRQATGETMGDDAEAWKGWWQRGRQIANPARNTDAGPAN